MTGTTPEPCRSTTSTSPPQGRALVTGHPGAGPADARRSAGSTPPAGWTPASFVSGYQGSPLGRAGPRDGRAPAATSTRRASCSGPASTRSSPRPPWPAPSCSTPSPAAATTASSGSGTARTPASTGPPTPSGTATLAGTARARRRRRDHRRRPVQQVLDRAQLVRADGAEPGRCRCWRPGSVAEVIEFGLHAVALSRATGLWTGLKIIADVADASATDRPRRAAPGRHRASRRRRRRARPPPRAGRARRAGRRARHAHPPPRPRPPVRPRDRPEPRHVRRAAVPARDPRLRHRLRRPCCGRSRTSASARPSWRRSASG